LEQPGSADAAIRATAPDIVVNAAAYTAVDRAEAEPERAFRINAEAIGEVGAAACSVGASVVHLSTDYVFGGARDRPWREDDPTGPINVYGASKLAGEERLRAASPRHLILRTSWVVSAFGHNFVRTMLRLASERGEVAVVADQRGCPTSAHDLAGLILSLAERGELPTGTFHAAGAEACNWAELASGIFNISAAAGGRTASVRPIATGDYPTPAARPRNSVLDCSKAIAAFGQGLPGWRESIPPIVHRLLEA
jgi:dTDP-4-dehydrorhamnose reductase